MVSEQFDPSGVLPPFPPSSFGFAPAIPTPLLSLRFDSQQIPPRCPVSTSDPSMATAPYCFPHPSAATYPPNFSAGYYPPLFSSDPAPAPGYFSHGRPPDPNHHTHASASSVGLPPKSSHPSSGSSSFPPPSGPDGLPQAPPSTPCSTPFPFGSSPDHPYGHGFIPTQASQTAYCPNQPPPLPVPATSEFSGDFSSWSPLCSRPMLQQQKEEGGKTEDGKAVRFAMHKFRCRDGDLPKSTNTIGTSIHGEKLVHKQPGPDIHGHGGSILHFAPAPSPEPDLYKSNGWQPEFQQGTTSDSIASHVFDQRPVPGYTHQLLGETPTPGIWNASYMCSTPIPCSCVQDYTLELATPAMENVCGRAPSSIATQAAASLGPGLSSNENDTAGSDLMLVHNVQLPLPVQDGSNMYEKMPVYDIYEEEKPETEQTSKYLRKASENKTHSSHSPMSAIAADLMQFQAFELLPVFDVDDDITGGCSSVFVDVFTGTPQQQIYEEEQKESEQAPKCFTKTICSLARPTIGVCSLRNEKKPDNEGISMCVNNTSDNTFSEDTTEFTFSHGHAIYADRSIELKNEKSTQATSTLCVREVIVHCHDERPEHINCTKGLDTVVNASAELVLAVQISEATSVAKHALFLLSQDNSFIMQRAAHLSESLTWHGSLPGTPFLLLNITNYTWDPGVSKLKDTVLDKCAVQVQFVQQSTELSLFSLEFSTSSQKRVQWDPGVKVSLYCWFNILTVWSEIATPFLAKSRDQCFLCMGSWYYVTLVQVQVVVTSHRGKDQSAPRHQVLRSCSMVDSFSTTLTKLN